MLAANLAGRMLGGVRSANGAATGEAATELGGYFEVAEDKFRQRMTAIRPVAMADERTEGHG